MTELERQDVPSRPLPDPVIYVGAESGAPPTVKAFDAETGAVLFERTVYEPAFAGGVRVATADFTGDGWPDLAVGPGAGGGPRVRVLDGKTGDPIPGPLGNFFAYEPTFKGGVEVAAADVTGDAWPDLIVAAGRGGGPRVRVFDGKTGAQLSDGFVFDPAFGGGVSVAAADFTGDGKAELVVGAGPGGGPHVRVIDLVTGKSIPGPLGSFFAYEVAFTGGVHVGADWKAGDVTADGRADLIVGPGAGRAPLVKVFSGATGKQARGYYAFDPGMTAGVRVAAAYVTDDPWADVVASTGPGVPDRVRVHDGRTSVRLAGPTGDFGPFGGVTLGGVALTASNDPPGGGTSPPPPPASPPPPPPASGASGPATMWGGEAGQSALVWWQVAELPGEQMQWTYWVYNVDMFTPDYDDIFRGVTSFGVAGYAGGVTDDTMTLAAAGWERTPGALSWGPVTATSILPGETGKFEFRTPPRPVVDATAAASSVLNTIPVPPPPPAVVKAPAVPPTVGLAIPELIPVNANNDNSIGKLPTERWKANTSNTIPITRDFDYVAPMNITDPQLLKTTLSVGGGLAGTLSLVAYGPNGPVPGAVRFWTDNQKSAPFTSVSVPAGGGFTKDVYVEGVHESYSMAEITVRAEFTTSGTAIPFTAKDEKQVAVTPIVNGQAISVITPVPTPYRDLAFGGRVTGLTAGVQKAGDPEPGSTAVAVQYDAQVVTGGYEAEAKFIHIVTNVTNTGATGVELVNGNRANFALPDGYTFHLNDAVTKASLPYYPTFPNPQADPNPNPYVEKNIYTHDTPGFSVNIGFSELKRMDLTFEAKLYLVWTYTDGSLYPLGWGSYKSVLAGDRQADGTFKPRPNVAKTEPTGGERSNAEPTKLVGPLYNTLFPAFWVQNVP